MDGMNLPPELEHFVDEAVANGRFRDRSDMVAAALRLLQQSDGEIANFVSSLEEAQAEGDRLGFRPAEQVHREMNTMLEETVRAAR